LVRVLAVDPKMADRVVDAPEVAEAVVRVVHPTVRLTVPALEVVLVVPAVPVELPGVVRPAAVLAVVLVVVALILP
jgi:hypothetical protein